MNRLLCSGLLALVLTACGSDTEILSEGDYLFFEPIGIGQAGATRDTLEVVVRDSVTWVNTSAQLRPLAPFKKVDFAQSSVIAIAMPTESGGYHIEVQSVEDMGEQVVVSYLFHKPAQDCITLSALALPFQVVSVRRIADKPVRFERSTQRYECTWKQP